MFACKIKITLIRPDTALSDIILLIYKNDNVMSYNPVFVLKLSMKRTGGWAAWYIGVGINNKSHGA